MAGKPGRPSYGLILCRFARGRVEAVAARSRYTYAYAEFVHGRYPRHDGAAMRQLFSCMTVAELLDLRSLDFDRMWIRIWQDAQQASLKKGKQRLFREAWMADGGLRLRRLLRGCAGAGRDRWGFPKGRPRSRAEEGLLCALREFGEETGIARRHYRLLPGYRRHVCHEHHGLRYSATYYLAYLLRPVALRIDLNRPEQTGEVAELRWMGLEALRLVAGPAGHSPALLARPAFNYLKKWRRRGRARGLALAVAPQQQRAQQVVERPGAEAPGLLRACCPDLVGEVLAGAVAPAPGPRHKVANLAGARAAEGVVVVLAAGAPAAGAVPAVFRPPGALRRLDLAHAAAEQAGPRALAQPQGELAPGLDVVQQARDEVADDVGRSAQPAGQAAGPEREAAAEGHLAHREAAAATGSGEG